MRTKMNRFLQIAMVIIAFMPYTVANAQEKFNPRFFVEMTGGVGTYYAGKFANHTGVYDINKTSTYGQWSPSVGMDINNRWSVGARVTFQTGGETYKANGHILYTMPKYNVFTLYGQYSFLKLNRWDVFVEGKGSYYHEREYAENTGEIGFSFGTKFKVTNHLSAVLHYIYTGVEVGDESLNHPDGCIGDGRFTLDFSPRRLQIGLRYTF